MVLQASINTRKHTTCISGSSVLYGAYFGDIFNFDRHRTLELRDVGILHVNESHALWYISGMRVMSFFEPSSSLMSKISNLVSSLGM